MRIVSTVTKTLFLIVLVIVVASIASILLPKLPLTSVKIAGNESGLGAQCQTAEIQITGVKYCDNYVSGEIFNVGNTDLGNISFMLFYTNTSIEKIYVQNNEGSLTKISYCCSNFLAIPQSNYIFNFSIGGSNYDTLRVNANCLNATISDEASNSKNEITASC